MADDPNPNPPANDPPADPPAPPANPPAPPANPPAGDHVTRTEFTTFADTVTSAIAGLTDAVTKLVDATPTRDQTAVGVPWTHRGSRRHDVGTGGTP